MHKNVNYAARISGEIIWVGWLRNNMPECEWRWQSDALNKVGPVIRLLSWEELFHKSLSVIHIDLMHEMAQRPLEEESVAERNANNASRSYFYGGWCYLLSSQLTTQGSRSAIPPDVSNAYKNDAAQLNPCSLTFKEPQWTKFWSIARQRQ